MTTSHARRYIIAATFVAAASASIVLNTTSSSGSTPKPPAPISHSTSHAWTPNDCIRRNGGDYNACNVGNSGRGDLPYLPASHVRTSSTRLTEHLARVR